MVRQLGSPWLVLPVALVIGIFVAGFFHEGEAKAAPAPCAPQAKLAMECPPARAADAMAGTIAVPEHLYVREADFTSRVDSVIDAYMNLDADLSKQFGGRIVSMEINGNDDGRQGTIQCAVSTDKFNDFVTYVRSKGRILSERIRASARPVGRPGAGDLDERELSLVTVRLIDEKVAKEVGVSKGLLAGSLSRSTSHFLSGLAVIVEGLGWVAPYALVLILIVAPFLIWRKVRGNAAVDAI